MDETSPEVTTNGIGLRHSPTIGKLTEALAKAEQEFGEVVKDTKNPFYKSNYADLSTLIKATRPALSKHGLAVIQSPRIGEKGAVVTTLLSHLSGEWIADDLALPATKPDAQGIGSAITYARRYAYQSILNIAGEEDDDGNAAVGKANSNLAELQDRMDGQARINQFQVKAFWEACEKTGKTKDQIKFYLTELNNYVQVEEIQKQHFNDAIKWANQKGVYSESALKASVEKISKAKKVEHNFPKLYATAHAHGVSEADLHTFAKEHWDKDSLKDLTPGEFTLLTEWAESQSA